MIFSKFSAFELRVIHLSIVAGVHGDFLYDFYLINGCPREADIEFFFEKKGPSVKGTEVTGVELVDGGFDLKGGVVFPFLGMAAEKLEVSISSIAHMTNCPAVAIFGKVNEGDRPTDSMRTIALQPTGFSDE